MTMNKRSASKAKAKNAAPTGRWVRGNRTQITLSIAPELLAQVDAIAQRKHLSRAALMTVWLGEKVEQDEREHERQ